MPPPPATGWPARGLIEAEVRRRIATDLRQSATILRPEAARIYREIADHIESGL